MHQYSGWSFRNQAPKLSELPGDISYDLCTATTLPYGQRQEVCIKIHEWFEIQSCQVQEILNKCKITIRKRDGQYYCGPYEAVKTWKMIYGESQSINSYFINMVNHQGNQFFAKINVYQSEKTEAAYAGNQWAIYPPVVVKNDHIPYDI